jgi:hypothetical protein
MRVLRLTSIASSGWKYWGYRVYHLEAFRFSRQSDTEVQQSASTIVLNVPRQYISVNHDGKHLEVVLTIV